jgi:hypothetical protein
MKRFSALGAFTLVVSVIVAGVVGACGGGGDTGGSAGAGGGFGGKNNPVGGGGNGGSVSTFVGSGGGNQQGLAVSPSARQTINVAMGAMTPTVKYTATKDGGPVSADWSTDRADIGTVPGGPASVVKFTPSGAAGGVVTVSATVGGKSASGSVLVKLSAKQNGPNDSDGEKKQMGTDVKSGGGIGGVGGEGLGTKVTDPSTLTALDHPSSPTAKSLVFLYPYDKTVWPRGMLAPLLQWDSTLGDADAIKIEMSTTSGSFSYSGTFGRPAILGNGAFIHHPVPQDMWDAATNSAGGTLAGNKPDELTVKLTVAKGGMAYGPITETYRVAPAKLTGTVYYNSYGTQYVKNWDHDTAGNQVGAAILGIRSGDIAPTLVLGLNSADHTGCRVCHVVASKGRWIIAQAEAGAPGDGTSRLYDLKAADIQASGATPMTPDGKYAWAAMTGDGSYALSNSINPSSSNPAMVDTQSTFYKFGPAPVAQGAVGAVMGLPANVSAGYPAYSPDDSMIAYVDASGSTTNIQGPIKVADYDNATHGFSNLTKVLDAPSGKRIGYPVFLPDNSGLVFETQVRTSQSDSVMVTRNGTRSELWWANLKGTIKPTRLDSINGLDPTGKLYLPKGPNNHGASAGPKTDHRRLDTELRAHCSSGRRGRLRVGRLHQPPHVR